MWILLFLLIGPIATKILVADKTTCPYILEDPLPAHLPYGMQFNLTGMKLFATSHADFTECVTDCCSNSTCNAALLVTKSDEAICWFVSCSQDSLCLPAKQYSDLDFDSGTLSTVEMVLVRPHQPPWPNITVEEDKICEVGLDEVSCPPQQHCRQLNEKSKNGVCRCGKGMYTTKQGCTPVTQMSTSPSTTTTEKIPDPVQIIVHVANRTVQLPDRNTSLTAYTKPAPTDLTFEWKLVSFQSNNDGKEGEFEGVESNSNSASLELSELAEGVYIYRVAVTSNSLPGSGETVASITVLPVPRVNTPPVAVIKPVNQTLTLPTNKAVLDGSQSTDDSDQGLEYTWTIKSGPVSYSEELPSVPTLTLNNLVAGNYTIKLTVKDSDGSTDTAMASLTVLKENDYPPTAIAGEDKIVFLPQNRVVLNGNQSSDDHEIVSWEWTKMKTDEGVDLPADITGARTAYLTVANLEQGIYNFLLKVTDSGGQSSTDDIAVYVKPPLNVPPTADAGQDQELSLPLPFFTLKGSGSTSNPNVNITSLLWTQISGPKMLNISKPARLETNVTGLTDGNFVFQFTVKDDLGNNGTDSVTITINKDRNQAPVAVIKKPGKIILPIDVVYLDGSESSDDLAIEGWQWHKTDDGLAAANIVGPRNTSRLALVDLVPGTYSFSLKVFDGQGKSDMTSVTFDVAQDPANKKAEVELVLELNISKLKQLQLKSILDAIKVLTKSKSEVELVKVYPARRTRLASIIFKVLSEDPKKKYMLGSEVVKSVSTSLTSTPDILEVEVHSLETVLCQNTCGGHGTCDAETRECVCDPFWIENFLSRHLLGAQPNCDWSVIYVAVIMVGCLAATCICYCLTRGMSRSKLRYNRLNTAENVELAGRSELLSSSTDTEEEEILYEAAKRKKYSKRLNRNGKAVVNGSANTKNKKSSLVTA